MRRDTKGLYGKAIAGQLKTFTGISDPYGVPPWPELTAATERERPAESAARVVACSRSAGSSAPPRPPEAGTMRA